MPATCAEMAAATAAPPATGSEPPSQKSFCTSTTISALAMVSTFRAGTLERGRDRRFALGELQALPRHADQRLAQPLPAVGQRRQVRHDVAAAHQRDLQLPVVLVAVRRVVPRRRGRRPPRRRCRVSLCRRSAAFRPPLDSLCELRFATGRPSTSTSL